MDRPTPTNVERTFERGELVVSKTDLKGRITYANRVFLRVAEYTERELIGKPHAMIRHPDMPRCVFRFMWERIEAGHEVFAYVKNLCRSGAYYWVFAHVTPTFGAGGRIVGYHSSRRVPSRRALDTVIPLYDELLTVEARHRLPKDQWGASLPVLVSKLEAMGTTYDEMIFSLTAA